MARERFPAPQLAGRQSRWYAGARAQPAAPAIRILRGPHSRHVRRASLDGRTRLLGLRALAGCGGDAGGLLRSLDRELSGDLYDRALLFIARPFWPDRAANPACGGERGRVHESVCGDRGTISAAL